MVGERLCRISWRWHLVFWRQQSRGLLDSRRCGSPLSRGVPGVVVGVEQTKECVKLYLTEGAERIRVVRVLVIFCPFVRAGERGKVRVLMSNNWDVTVKLQIPARKSLRNADILMNHVKVM